MTCHPKLSLRQPESTLLLRVRQIDIRKFLDILEHLGNKNKIMIAGMLDMGKPLYAVL
jgi:hypothetical protein